VFLISIGVSDHFIQKNVRNRVTCQNSTWLKNKNSVSQMLHITQHILIISILYITKHSNMACPFVVIKAYVITN
jgi:hypothetical protein